MRSLRAHPSSVRCAICHDDLVRGALCSLCGARCHVECFELVARCPTLGCAGDELVLIRRRRGFELASLAALVLAGVAALAMPAKPGALVGKKKRGSTSSDVKKPADSVGTSTPAHHTRCAGPIP